VKAAAAASGARLIAVRAGVPDGCSAIVALQVSDPASFLQHRLGPLNDRLQRLKSDGTFIALYLPDGRPLYSEGGSTRLDGGLGGPAAPRYASCIPNQMEGISIAPPLPCPSDSRPPPSTPQTPPKIRGYASGGTALDGGWNGKAGITVPYTTGATGARLRARHVRPRGPHVPARAPRGGPEHQVPTRRYWIRLTARAASRPIVVSDVSDSIIIRSFAQRESGIVSVGLNAVAVVNDTNT
jgi:hypothetical protein